MKTFFSGLIKFFQEADIFLFTLSLLSSVYGIILISSVVRNSGGSEIFVQIGALIVGIVLFVVFSYLDIDVISDKSKMLYVASVLFISTLFLWGVGTEETGNNAWIRFAGIGIQPAEIVKIPFIIIIASMMVSYKERRTLDSFPSLLKIVFVFGSLFALIIVSSADLGSALVYFFILLVMLYIAGVKLRWFFLGFIVVGGLTPLAWRFFLSEKQQRRILAPFVPSIDPDKIEEMWQASLSSRAIASGGFFGQGLYNGRITQSNMIPAQRTDFIFSAAGEELGFIGCLLIILLLTMIIIRCFYVGSKSNNPLGMLVCTGIGAMLIVQTLENIGMCLALSPVVGLTLPFFSGGGSSIVTSFAAMGIVSGIKMRPKPVRFRYM